MDTLVSYPRDQLVFGVPRTAYRQQDRSTGQILAMHWDGTYRDTFRGPGGYRTHNVSDHPVPAQRIAKHLA